MVFTNSRLTTEEQFGNIVVRANPQQNSIVYLKDVARVQLGKVSYAANSFVDGQRSSYLLVYQAPGSNALATADGVYKALVDAKKSSLPISTTKFLLNRSRWLRCRSAMWSKPC